MAFPLRAVLDSWAFRMVLVSYVREARVRRVQLLKRDLLRCCLAHSRASRAPTSADALFRMIVWRFAYGLRYARPLVGMSYLKLCVDEPRAPRAVGQRQQQQERLNMWLTLPPPGHRHVTRVHHADIRTVSASWNGLAPPPITCDITAFAAPNTPPDIIAST